VRLADPFADSTLLAPAAPLAPSRGTAGAHPLHTRITATVFWIGEPRGAGSSEDNAVSAWDDAWLEHYGGYDDPARRWADNDFFPTAFEPKENPFYCDLPYDDFDGSSMPRANRTLVVPWAADYRSELAAAARAGRPFSLLKNRWLRISANNGRDCYAQWEDSGPYVYDDAAYVFGATDVGPRSRRARNAGIDVSPAVRDCLGFAGLNDDANVVDWQFVEERDVPPGPWKRVVTTRQVFWP